MQVHMRSFRLSGGWGLVLVLAALVLLPFALLFALALLTMGLVGTLVSALLGRPPHGAVETPRRPPLREAPPKGNVLDAEYEVKDEP